MFNRLPESNARRQRRTGGFVVSTVVHLALIALAVQATGLTATPRPKPEPAPRVLIFEPPRPPRSSPPQPHIDRSHPNPRKRAIPAPPTITPTIPDAVPDKLPDLGSMTRMLNHLLDGTNPGRIADPTTGVPNVGDGPLTAGVVEKAVVALPGNAVPRYPSMLQSAGVEGSIRAQFVVDTLGRVEQGSFRALESTHDLFTAAVREALVRARFTPAELGGHKVRQLVEQTFTFNITR